ncbi:TPA: hypothetical protein ACKONO_002832 [Clostridioides difficile]
MRAYAKEHVGLTRAVFELYRGVFSCFVVMQASALSVGQRLLFIAETKEQCNKKGNVKEVMEIRLRSKLKSVLIVHYLKILYNRN